MLNCNYFKKYAANSQFIQFPCTRNKLISSQKSRRCDSELFDFTSYYLLLFLILSNFFHSWPMISFTLLQRKGNLYHQSDHDQHASKFKDMMKIIRRCLCFLKYASPGGHDGSLCRPSCSCGQAQGCQWDKKGISTCPTTLFIQWIGGTCILIQIATPISLGLITLRSPLN